MNPNERQYSETQAEYRKRLKDGKASQPRGFLSFPKRTVAQDKRDARKARNRART